MLSKIERKFPSSQATSPSKMGWRSSLITTWRATAGLMKLSPGDSFITLGGQCSMGNGKVIPNCEYDQVVLQERFCHPSQYVSIERDESIHAKNETIRGPAWICGDFGERFADWYYTGGRHAALVSADLMSGIDVSMESIFIVFDTVRDNQKRGKFSLIVFNIIERNLVRENLSPKENPYRYKPVWETLRDDGAIAKQRKGFVPVSRFSYWSGPHLTSTELTTLAFGYQT